MVDTTEFNLVPENEEEEFVVDFGEVVNVGGGGTSDFNGLTNRPKYNGQQMTGDTDIPKVPTKTSELTNDGSDGTSTYVEADDLATVATSGSYNDLSNKPTIPTPPTVVQTAGSSTTDVMSQNATTSMIYADPNIRQRIRISTNATASADKTIAIGAATANKADSIAIGTTPGDKTEATGAVGIAIGSGAKASATWTIALGGGAVANTQGQMDISTGSATTSGYNSSNYRLLTGLHDPQNAHDAATKGYVDSQAGGPTVVQTTGTSTTDVMSQNATTSMVFQDPSTTERVQIGASSSSTAYHTVAIGAYSRSASARSLALGASSYANAASSVALGAGATTSTAGTVDVGCSGIGGIGYNSTDYRLITGVHDPVNAHDAATKAYVDANAGGSSYKTLTEADYNWNSVNKTTTGTLDSIAPWLLDDGIYYVDNTVYVAQTNSASKATNTIYAKKSFIVFKDPEINGISTGILLYSPGNSTTQPLFVPYMNNGSLQIGSLDGGLLLNRANIQNNLTTTTAYRVLDARQGKALKDLIDALDSRVSALEGN